MAVLPSDQRELDIQWTGSYKILPGVSGAIAIPDTLFESNIDTTILSNYTVDIGITIPVR